MNKHDSNFLFHCEFISVSTIICDSLWQRLSGGQTLMQHSDGWMDGWVMEQRVG